LREDEVMANAMDVVCVGNIVVDAVGVNVERIPAEGSMTLFDKVEMHLGGCSNNAALALAKLGLKVALVAKVGQDGLGDLCDKVLTQNGVDVRGLKRSAADSTSFSFIMIPPSGNRRIFHTLAANATFGPRDIDYNHFTGAKWIFLGGIGVMPGLEGENLAQVLKAGRQAGARTAVDTATNDRFTRADWEKVFAPCYEHLDVFFPSEEEAHVITGLEDPRKICESFRARGVKIAGVKLGAKGSAVLSDDGFHLIPSYQVKCIDTLGAGDCFMAGFLSGLINGLKPKDAAQLGNAVSAHCVQAVGATTGIPKLTEVIAFQKKN
jgi:sugar/nucleoside kinase (ribokinase family)